MKIGNITLLFLRNDAHFQFFADFCGLVNEEGAERLKIAPQFEALAALYRREDEAFGKITKSRFTAMIRDADKARDEMFAGMAAIAKTCLKHYDARVREAAGRLKILFGAYKNAGRKSLIEQTAAVTNIMQELNGRYAPDASAVGVGGWAAQLGIRNDALNALIKERFGEAAARTDIVLKDARAQVDRQYKAIAERINALAIVDGSEAYESFIRRLNAIIAKYAQYAGASRGRRAAKRAGSRRQPPESGDGAAEIGETLIA
jgi:hypothetical protein